MMRTYWAGLARDTNSGPSYIRTVKWLDLEDGRTVDFAHVFPRDTLAIRAGEYGLDPTDTALILDVVLHEPFISYPDDDHPLWTASSIKEAREHHLDVVADTRKQHEERIGADRRPAEYPTLAVHRARLLRTAELAPIYPAVVDAGRRMARNIWREAQVVRPRPTDETGRHLSNVELALAGFPKRRD